MGPVCQTETIIYTLTAPEARATDSGVWRCELTNNFGTSTAKCSVKVVDSDDIEKEVAPCFVEYLDNAVVNEDKAVTFRCKAAGKPEPEVKWFRNEIPIDPSGLGSDSRFTITRGVNGEESLEVRRAKLRDAGIYKCKVMNSAGWAACDAKLVVQENPDDELVPYLGRKFDYTLADKIKARKALELRNEADILASNFCDCDTIRKFLVKWKVDDDQTLGFPVHLSSKCAVAGVSVVLGCLVKGAPPLRIRWYKDNKEVFEDGNYFIRNKQGFLSLEIPCAQEEDTGNYMCEVRNDQGKIYTSCYLQIEPVLELTSEVPTKPTFIKPMKRLTVNEGEIIRFRVAVKAYPAPGFKWFKDGMEIHDTDRITTEVMPNGVAQLIIENANIRDIGLYTCEAHNFAGRARNMVRISVRDQWEAEALKGRSLTGKDVTTKSTSVTEADPVQNGVTPTVDYTPSHRGGVFAYEPMFTLKLPNNVTVKEKGHLLLECCCNGNPKPKVTWFKDSKPIAEGERCRFLSLGDWYGLEILEALPNDAGIFTVMLDNSAGEAVSSCTVDIKPYEEQEEVDGNAREKAGELLNGIASVATLQSQHTVELFKMGMFGPSEVVASCHLCDTEADWSANTDKEIKVTEVGESPSFSPILPDRIRPTVDDENVTLSCRVAGQPCSKVEWFKDKQLIEDNDRITTEWDFKERLATLMFKKISANMSGKYTCVAYSDLGGQTSTATEVIVKGIDEPDTDQTIAAEEAGTKTVPGFKLKLQDKETKEGSEVKLEVQTEGYPAPEIKWYKNDKEIKANIEKYFITSTDDGLHTLIIAKTHLSDSDCYKCEAINECGAVSTCAHILVQEDCQIDASNGSVPSFSEPLHSVTTTVGQDAVLKCTADGKPDPTLHWVRDEATPISTTDRLTVTTDGLSTMLKISSCQPEDAGLYYCIAENEHGKVKSCTTLKVNAAGSGVKSKSDDVNTQKNEVTNKDNAASTGTVENAIVTPSNESDKLDATTKTSTADGSKTSETKSRELDSVDQIDSVGGVPSVVGEISSQYIKVPTFVVRPSSQWIIAKEPFTISCKVVKSGEVKVKWFHNGQDVSNGRYKIEVKAVGQD